MASRRKEDQAQEALDPYTHPRQVSPGRKRGRIPTLGRARLNSRLSLDAVLSAKEDTPTLCGRCVSSCREVQKERLCPEGGVS